MFSKEQQTTNETQKKTMENIIKARNPCLFGDEN
jgi:hypothetical protein